MERISSKFSGRYIRVIREGIWARRKLNGEPGAENYIGRTEPEFLQFVIDQGKRIEHSCVARGCQDWVEKAYRREGETWPGKETPEAS